MDLDIVGMVEIAERLRVPWNTVSVWRKRGLLPAPAGMIGTAPWWHWSDIERWSEETGHPKRRRVGSAPRG